MKCLSFITPAFLLLPCLVKAQSSNPFKSIGKDAEMLTLSKGRYQETFDEDTLQRVGSVVINSRTNTIVQLLDADSLSSETSDNSSASRWYSIDPLAEKYVSYSPYNFVLNNPINAIDPDGRDVILLVWASHDGKIGHAGIAVSNYKEVTTRVQENGKWVNKKEMVADGTYTYRDLWPGGDGAGKSNFDKNVPGIYNEGVFTLDQLKNRDVTNSEGYAADGVIQLSTDKFFDDIVMEALDAHQANNPSYNGLTNNCTDFVEAGAIFATDKKVDATEKLTSKTSAATPNQLYKSASKSPNATVLKDPGTKVNQGFVEAVSGGGKKQGKAEDKID